MQVTWGVDIDGLTGISMVAADQPEIVPFLLP